MNTGAILASLLTLLATHVLAAQPFAFKGMALGASNAGIVTDPRFACQNVRAPNAEQICSLRPKEQETMAGERVESLYYFFDRARLTAVVVGINAVHFDKVATALSARYGAPEVSLEQVKNYKGESFENRTLSWRQAAHTLQAQRYAGRLDRSVIRITDHSAAERIRQRRATPPVRDL